MGILDNNSEQNSMTQVFVITLLPKLLYIQVLVTLSPWCSLHYFPKYSKLLKHMHHLKEHISETAYICKVIGHSFIPPEQQICDSPSVPAHDTRCLIR